MPTLIICPSCKHQFAPEDAIAKSLEKEYQEKFNNDRQKLLKQFSDQQKILEEQQKEFERKKENENKLFAERMEKEKLKMESELQEKLHRSISNDFENRLKLLQESNQDIGVEADHQRERSSTARAFRPSTSSSTSARARSSSCR